ncbi:MAG: PulJ/GspJ family protein [Bdellovibrio sp.]
MNRFLKNQSGMSLIEIIIVSAIGVVIMVSVTAMIVNVNKGAQNAQQQSELEQ